MYRQETATLPATDAQVIMNANIGELDTFITPDPTPKTVSRRQWRRRRVRRGKS